MTDNVLRAAVLTVPCLFGLWTAVACRRAQYHGLRGSDALIWAGLSGAFFLLSLMKTTRGLGLLRGFGDFLRGIFKQRGWYESRRSLQIAASIAVAVVVMALVLWGLRWTWHRIKRYRIAIGFAALTVGFGIIRFISLHEFDAWNAQAPWARTAVDLVAAAGVSAAAIARLCQLTDETVGGRHASAPAIESRAALGFMLVFQRKFTRCASDTDATGTSAASASMGVTIVPNITSFSGANNATFSIDGATASVQNANQSWSLTEPDSHTLQFSLHSGDHWSVSTWSDLTQNNGAERDEVALAPQYPENTQINVSYGLTLQPGPANTASWLLLSQFHQTPANGSPPFAVEMVGEHMRIVMRYELPGRTSPTMKVLWKDPNPIVRGQTYAMNIQVNFDNIGNGYLNVWRDGVQIVNYQGPIGYGSDQNYYFKEGIYRSSSTNDTQTADFNNLQITTGSAPVPPKPSVETLGAP